MSQKLIRSTVDLMLSVIEHIFLIKIRLKIISNAFRFAARHCSLTAYNLTNNCNAITDLHCSATQNFLQICNFLLGLLKSLVWDQTFGQDESFERRR